MFTRKSLISQSLLSLANAIEARDPYTGGHTWRVSRYAVALANEMKLSKKQIAFIELGAILHDLGKISIPDVVLHKPSKLSDDEFAIIQSHPRAGYRILANEKAYTPFRAIIEHHHERIDGKGYPDKLKGDDIPFEARLLAIVDTFDAMTSHRPYRKALDPQVALQELDRHRGVQFDSRMVDHFHQVWESGALKNIILHSAEGVPLKRCPAHGEIIASDPISTHYYGSACPACSLALLGIIE